MIVFDLECRAGGHRFEGWFGSSAEFDSQCERGLVACPQCGSQDVGKALMAPNVARKGNQLPAPAAPQARPAMGGKLPPEAAQVMQALAQLQAAAIKQSRWVGENFAEETRAQHYGEREAELIHGQATAKEAKDLLEEGIAVMPLLIPIAPPDEVQ